MLYDWDGQPTGPGLPQRATSDRASLRSELAELASRLSLSEEDSRRVFITPPNGRPEQERFCAVTRLDHGVFQSTIYELDDLTVLAELNLDNVFASLYGGMSGDPDKREFQVSSVARNSLGDLVLLMFFSAGGTFAAEFGSWDGADWTPVQLPDSYNPRNTLSEFHARHDPWQLDRIDIGPNNEILLSSADKTISFYGRDMATGGFILQQSYNVGEVAAHIKAARGSFRRTSISIALIFLSCLGLLVILFLQLRRPRPRRPAA